MAVASSRRRRSRSLALAVLALVWIGVVLSNSSAAQDSSVGDRVGVDSVGVPGEVSLFDGQLSMPVDMPIPPGRSQTTPNLKLVYSSASGDGPFGVGWELPVGAIGLNPRNGVPQCVGGSQVLEYVLEMPGGRQELIHVAGDLHRAKTDNSFFDATLDESTNTWTVSDRSGMNFIFGAQPGAASDASARVFVGSDTILDPNSCHYTTRWALTRVVDPVGNSIEYHYEKVGNVLYVSTILYGGNPVASPAIAHPFRIVFSRTTRPRAQTRFALGARIDLDQVVETVDIEWRSNPAASFAQLRTFTLAYSHRDGGSVALLSAVEGTGFPTRSFEYSSDQLQLGPPIAVADPEGWDDLRRFASGGQSEVRRTVMDANGDGFADVVDASGGGSGWRIGFGSAAGGGATGTWTGTAQLPFRDTFRRSNSLTTGGTRTVFIETMDLTGDGLIDYIDARTTPWIVYPGRCIEVSGAQSCGFGAPASWAAPQANLEESLESNYQRTSSSSLT